jgi:hypothetical protein
MFMFLLLRFPVQAKTDDNLCKSPAARDRSYASAPEKQVLIGPEKAQAKIGRLLGLDMTHLRKLIGISRFIGIPPIGGT